MTFREKKTVWAIRDGSGRFWHPERGCMDLSQGEGAEVAIYDEEEKGGVGLPEGGRWSALHFFPLAEGRQPEDLLFPGPARGW